MLLDWQNAVFVYPLRTCGEYIKAGFFGHPPLAAHCQKTEEDKMTQALKMIKALEDLTRVLRKMLGGSDHLIHSGSTSAGDELIMICLHIDQPLSGGGRKVAPHEAVRATLVALQQLDKQLSTDDDVRKVFDSLRARVKKLAATVEALQGHNDGIQEDLNALRGAILAEQGLNTPKP